MQLALPKLRTDTGLKSFNSSLKSVGYDLTAWRKRAGLSSKDTIVLDADDSAGWQLAEALLRPREIEVDEETGSVKFVNTNREAARLGVSLALTHRFMRQVYIDPPCVACLTWIRCSSLCIVQHQSCI